MLMADKISQIWLGTIIGFAICFVIGAGMIGAFYGLGANRWAATEDIWEGTFCIVASVVITVMGVALLRISKMQDKWRVKLARALEARDSANKIAAAGVKIKFGKKFKLWCEKYAMFMLPFVTILREGLEAVVFIGGVSLGLPATSIPLPTVCGLLAGSAIGYIIYLGGNKMPIQVFLIISTCFLYLVAAGLFSRGIWNLQQDQWNKITGGDAAENGAGPGSYDIRQSVWHVNCCSPELNGGGGWGIFNALLGWTNSATYGSVIGYNMYWIAVMTMFITLRFKERNGRWPFMKAKTASADGSHGLITERKQSDSETSSNNVASERFEAKSDGQSQHAGVRTIQEA